MKDPILDEDIIVDLLSAPVTAVNMTRLQYGAVQALIDLYDRGCTREEFIAMAAPCIALSRETAKLLLIDSIGSLHRAGVLTDAAFTEAQNGLEALIRKQAEQVIEVVKRLQLCPTSQDKVH